MSKVIFTRVTLGALPVSFPLIAARPADLSALSAFKHRLGCDRFIPHYESENGGDYDARHGEHQSEVEEIERSPEFRKMEERFTSYVDSRFSLDEICQPKI